MTISYTIASSLTRHAIPEHVVVETQEEKEPGGGMSGHQREVAWFFNAADAEDYQKYLEARASRARGPR